MKKFETCVMV